MDYRTWLHDHCPKKLMSASAAMSKIKRGSRVFIGTGCGEPQHLIRAMVDDMSLQDIMIYQMLSITLSEYMDSPSFLKRFLLKLFFVSRSMRKAAFEGKIDYIPAYLSQIPRLFSSQFIGLDVALVQVSPPDKYGYCSLGVSIDITRSGMENAKLVIAQVNASMPRTWGDTFVHVDELDFIVLKDEPLLQSIPVIKDNDITRRIGHYISQLVDDGSTLQIGFGHLPDAILQYLSHKKDLGIHTQVITDGLLSLMQSNVVNNKKKTFIPGRVLASLCMGSEQLYDYIDDNPVFYFQSSEFVNDPVSIARNDNLISISSALEVDLTGQICTDSMGYLIYSGIGDQVDFIRGSAMSKGGFSIIALPSTAKNGTVSRIVSHLSEGAGVATTRADVNFVVTEYGIAELKGKGLYQRVMELAQIAHPKFRESLIGAAKRHHLIFADQIPPSTEDLLFLENYKSTLKLKNGKTVMFRPILPSDEFGYRNFFYSLQEETIYSRFFYKMRLFTHEVIQKQWAVVDYRNNMSIIGLVQKGGHKEIVAIGSYAALDEKKAEIAFVVHDDFQNMGIASYILSALEKIAKENNYMEFMATVLKANAPMLYIFKKRYPHAKFSGAGRNDHEIVMRFDDAVEPQPGAPSLQPAAGSGKAKKMRPFE
ncbi:MAG: GNAT family N-acetyltransferase [Desulfobacterales bacterium]|nr:GNAT family N-acetyltransferase [Desulfobacterales bacterium]